MKKFNHTCFMLSHIYLYFMLILALLHLFYHCINMQTSWPYVIIIYFILRVNAEEEIDHKNIGD